MHVLLQDGMEIKEGDEVSEMFYSVRHGVYSEWKPAKNINWDDDPIVRRKLTTMEEVQAFWKEAKECVE